MKQRSWIIASGCSWALMGCLLLSKGLLLLTEAAFQPGSLCDQMKELLGSAEQAANLWIGVSLLIGFFKGRFILAKTVRRVVNRIVSLSSPIRFRDVYSPFYWLLIISMMGLGMGLRFLPIPIEIRGSIDIAVGSALIQGAFLYFRSLRALSTYDTDSPF